MIKILVPHGIRFVNEYQFSVSAASVKLSLCPRVELENYGEDPGAKH